MFVSLSRVLKFAGQNFVRNAWMTVATVTVLTLTLVSVNILLVLNILGKVALTTVQDKIDISVHFKQGVDESRVQTAKITLMSLPQVKDVKYISSAEGLETFSADYKNDQGLLEALNMVESNPFGATLVVRAKRLEDYPAILATLSDPLYAEIIDEKNYQDPQTMIAKVESFSKKADFTGLIISTVFGFIALLIVFNTIRMSIFTRKEEIGIMRLVGASDWIIRTPFYVEAMMWCALALVLAMAIVVPSIRFVEPYLAGFFGTGTIDIMGFYVVNWPMVVGSQFLGAVIVAIVTTKVATSKYLKV